MQILSNNELQRAIDQAADRLSRTPTSDPIYVHTGQFLLRLQHAQACRAEMPEENKD